MGRKTTAKKGESATSMNARVAVVGAGSWGTALASLLAGEHEHVAIWSRGSEVADLISQKHENRVYLPGIKLPHNLSASTDLPAVLDGADMVVMVVPSHAMRATAEVAAPHIDSLSLIHI